MALAGVEERMASSENAATSVEGSRLRVQRERKTAMCEALKSQLEAMNVTSGLFPEQQLAGIRAFAARVDKKKAYRKRVKRRRCAEASLSRAANAKKVEKVGSTDDSTATKEDAEKPRDREEASRSDTVFPESRPSEQCLDPETLTLDSLIKVRRAWDLYIVFPQTRGASAIPPHFVSPPPTPSAPWAEYASLSS
ncbi:hypothetical protein PInf_007630 [Phytophthora infestans]|nr:hypothetical protein PInf_007630 [Phytophthora infestans]